MDTVQNPTEKKKVFIDWRGALLDHERKTGNKTTNSELADDHGITTNTLKNWDKEAPLVVQFLFDFIKQTGCTFEDLVKEKQ